LSEAEWQISHSKFFLRSESASKLEVLGKLQQLAIALVMEKCGRKIACLQAGRQLAVWIRTAVLLPDLIGC
jgi:hypothetical protein